MLTTCTSTFEVPSSNKQDPSWPDSCLLPIGWSGKAQGNAHVRSSSEPGPPITSVHLPYGHSYLQERLGMVIQLCPQEKGESGCWWSQLAGFVSCAPYAVPFLAGNVSLPPSWLYGFYMLFQSHLSMHSFRSSFLTRVWVRYSLIASVVPKNLLQFYSYYSPIIYFLISPHTRPWGLWH